MIALAYTRRNLWPEAEIFRTKCHERATPTDPLPDWMPEADKQIDNAIATANVAEVTISIEPADAAAAAQLTVSSFAPDEKFPPRVIHLPPGIHQIFASAPGYEDGHQLVDIKDKTPQKVVIKLMKPGEAPPPEVGKPATEEAPSKLPWVVMGAGVGVVAIGGVFNLLARNEFDKINGKPVGMFDDSTWKLYRNVSYGSFVVGGAAIATGVILKLTVFKNKESAPAVSFVPQSGGAMFSVGWAR